MKKLSNKTQAIIASLFALIIMLSYLMTTITGVNEKSNIDSSLISSDANEEHLFVRVGNWVVYY